MTKQKTTRIVKNIWYLQVEPSDPRGAFPLYISPTCTMDIDNPVKDPGRFTMNGRAVIGERGTSRDFMIYPDTEFYACSLEHARRLEKIWEKQLIVWGNEAPWVQGMYYLPAIVTVPRFVTKIVLA